MQLEKDSYQKFAEDILGVYNPNSPSVLFSNVKECDMDEVRVVFAVNIAHLEYADNFRIFPLKMEKEFMEQKRKGCCGSWNSQVKCLSGNIYWIGCNYGH